ncbi:MAG: sugar phosphate nucleotidyltransferase [Lachnospiraceae bacterium]|nr:sugar phosphate nucleotidyltransferase [Lachnospiraceae bacterium]
MAAGIGSRYSGGIKQLEVVGPNGECIMDYSIHDAIDAGFDKIVFIIREDIYDFFKEIMGNRIEHMCVLYGIKVEYCFQKKDDIPEGFTVPEDRTKPWGTGQAVLAARDVLDCPFCVINADDYYGKEAFRKVHDFLVTNEDPLSYCMAGFILKNTLSDHGTVTRGVCKVDERGRLLDIVETKEIRKTEDGAASGDQVLDPNGFVSMNMWGLKEGFIDILKERFIEFFKNDVAADPLKAEYLLPILVGKLLKMKRVTVDVLETSDEWFGVTYKEDKAQVVEAFNKLIADGVYQNELYSDLYKPMA